MSLPKGSSRLLVALTALLVALPASAGAAGPGEVGGPPTSESVGLGDHYPKALPKYFPRPRSKPIVIGVGTTSRGRVEIVAQASTHGVCTFISYPEGPSNTSGLFTGYCPTAAPHGGDRIVERAFSWSERWHRPFVDVIGTVVPEAASVLTAVESEGKRKNVSAVIARPDASILERLHTSEPLNVFYSTFLGCIPPHKTISIAYDAAGAELGRKRGVRIPRRDFIPACRVRDPYEPHLGSVGPVPDPLRDKRWISGSS